MGVFGPAAHQRLQGEGGAEDVGDLGNLLSGLVVAQGGGRGGLAALPMEAGADAVGAPSAARGGGGGSGPEGDLAVVGGRCLGV